MRHGNGLIRALALLLILLPGLPTRAADRGQTQWKLNTFTWVKRVPAEAGAPANAHPANVSQAALLQALTAVQTQVEGTTTPLFEKKEAAALAKALQEALELARPDEDLILLSTQRRGNQFMDPSLTVTARLFVREGALNLIARDTRLNFMDRYLVDHTVPEFAYGSRKAAARGALQAEGARQLRPDWLALGLTEPAVAPAPIPAVTPMVATAPQVAVPVAPKRDEAFYEAQATRLKALKRMRDDNLLSEAEYQEKRDAILKTL